MLEKHSGICQSKYMDAATTKQVTETLKAAAERVAHLKSIRGKALAAVEAILTGGK